MDASTAATSGSVANAHDINLRQLVQDKILTKVLKHVTQLTRGWVVLVVDDYTTRILTYAVRMSDLTDCGVSIIERLELNRQPFPEMNVVYFITPSVENIRQVAQDFAIVGKPKYSDAFVYFLSHADDAVFAELKTATGLLPKLRALQEVHTDFLALEKCAFSLDMPRSFHQLYSPVANGDDTEILQKICEKLISVCATMEEYPYVRYKVDQPRMERLAHMFQGKINEFVSKNESFKYAPNRGTLLFMDRGQDLVTPVMHESTFQALVYDLIDVTEEQITYPAETNAGTVNKTAYLNENDKFWIEFRHTHIAKVSEEIGRRMTQLSSSKAGSSLGKGKSGDLQSMAAALRELPEYREMLGKLSQHLWLAGKTMDIFTKTKLLEISNMEQCLATGVDESGKKFKLKHSAQLKQLEDVIKNAKLDEADRFRLIVIFTLTQDTIKDGDKEKIIQSAMLSKKYTHALNNLLHVGGAKAYKQHGNSNMTPDELKDASKKAADVEYSNARYEPRLKSTLQLALKGTLSEQEYPFIIAPPLQSSSGGDSTKKKHAPVSLRKKAPQKSSSSEKSAEKDEFSGDKMLVFICGGATYSELRSIYELRAAEKRDIILGTTAFLKPNGFVNDLAVLHEPAPLLVPPSGHGSEVAPLSKSDIHVHLESQQKPAQDPFSGSSQLGDGLRSGGHCQ